MIDEPHGTTAALRSVVRCGGPAHRSASITLRSELTISSHARAAAE
jgi:hypothetical protein